jgi:hypothetical protein
VLKSSAMSRASIRIGICAVGLFFAGGGAARQDATPPAGSKANDRLLNPEAVQGCYDLTLSPWFPPMRLGDDEALITPPQRIQLLLEKGTEEPESRGYLVRPAPGATPSIHSSMYWVPKSSKALEITFTDGFSGLVMGLKTSDAETLHGKAMTFWDFDRKRQAAEVMAHRVPCGK